MTVPVHGEVVPAFAVLREVLAEHLAAGLDVGFGFCLYVRGEPVAELWGGHADGARRRTWSQDTLVPLTSITKTVLGTAILRLAEQGRLDLEAPIADCWPEFAAHGKERITVAAALSHRAGIPYFPVPVTLRDELAWEPVIRRIEQMRPIWPPGSAHGYHAIVLGFLLCEILRRVTGQEASTIVREQIIEPLGLDLHLSLDGRGAMRLAEVVPRADDVPPNAPPPELREYVAGFSDPSSLLHRATFGSTAMTLDEVNDPRYYSAKRPAAYATAAATARMYAALVSLVDGHRLLTADSARRACTELSAGMDAVFRLPTRWGLGFMLPGGHLWPDFGRPAFGHIGSTGALAFADPKFELAFAFLPNQRKSLYEVPDRRAQALLHAVYRVAECRMPAVTASSAQVARP